MNNPINKSNLRKPLKIILLLIILFMGSNLFISSASQFFIVNREINNISMYYRSIGTITEIETPIDYNYNIKEAQEIITGDPMIDFEDNRRQTTGIIDGLYSIERHSPAIIIIGGSYIEDLIFVGEIDSTHKSRSADNIYQGSILVSNVREILAGIPNFIEGDYTYGFDQEHHFGFMSHSLVTGEKIEYINDDVIDALFELEPGKKYLFRTFIDLKLYEGSTAKPLYDGGPLYIELDDSGYIDWDDPKFSVVKEEIDFINENVISYNVIGTKDMTAMPELQDSMKDFYLLEGRWIDSQDNINQNQVIVIHEAIAERYGINIGDKLEMKMRDSEYGYILATEKDRKEWKTYYTSEPIFFEVVGIFESNTSPRRLYSYMYVPGSTIPQELGRYTKGLDEPIPFIKPDLYSFVLKSVGDESAFIEKYEEKLKELGYDLNFIINNGESFLESTIPIKRSSTISLVLFSILLMLIQAFVVYIYVDGHKLNYAIQRALGIPAKVSGRHLILPLIISGTLATMVGGYLGYNNAMKKSMELLASLAESTQGTINSGLDIKYFVSFVILSIVPFVAMLLFRINKLRNLSVIDLINSNKRKKRLARQDEAESGIEIEGYEIAKATTAMPIETEVVPKKSDKDEEPYIDKDKGITIKGSKKALRGFSLSHILRSKITSMLLIILAGVFVFSLLWMNYLTIKNNDLIDRAYKENIITGDIIIREGGSSKVGAGPINRRHIENLFETGLVDDYTAIAEMFYPELYIDRDGIVEKYEAGEKDTVHFLTRKPTFVAYASNKSYNSQNGGMALTELNFVEGHSLEDFDKEYRGDYSNHLNPIIVNEDGKEGFPILVSNSAMEHFNLELGNKVFLEPNLQLRNLSIESYGTIVGTFKEIEQDKDLYGYSKINRELDLFIYPISALQSIERELYYNKLEFEFKSEKNKELMERKEEIRKIVSNNPFNNHPTELRLWDGELTNVIGSLEKSLSLLEVLYPVTLILSVILAGILAFMMVLRRTLDVSILRILGVKGKEVQWNLFRENLLLVLIGIVASSIIVFAITTNSFPIDLTKYAMVCGGYLLGTIVGLILGILRVTNRKPLEMLQVKE